MNLYKKFRKGYQEVIDIATLQEGEHGYEFTLREDFLDDFSRNYIEEIRDATIKVSLKKSKNFIEAELEIDGDLPLVCDKCLSPFFRHVHSREKIIYYFENKFTNDTENESFRIIGKDEQFLDFGQDIYDLFCLNVPIKKECGTEACDAFVSQYSSVHKKEKKVDERFKDLLDLFPPEE